MATVVFAFIAVSLVVVAIQFSCLIAYQAPKREISAPANGCTES